MTGARALAHRMGIPHLTLDLRDRFRADVVDDFLAGYAGGSTPNPCVRCNGLVRFDAMLDLARDLGSSRLATGHYARIADDGEGPLVRAGADPAKDQSYVLARLTGAELERLRFPLGELDKPRVRELAAAAGLPVARKPESQDLCFLAGTGAPGLPAPPRRRAIRAAEAGGDDRGPARHACWAATTATTASRSASAAGIGRGRGPSRCSCWPRTPGRNRVVVGPRVRAGHHARVDGARCPAPAEAAVRVRVRLRYHSPAVPCSLTQDLPAGATPRWTPPWAARWRATAAGQTACLMDGDLVVGWGTLAGRTGG